MDKLMGSPAVREAIEAKSLDSVFASWIAAQDAAYVPSRVDLYR